MCLSGFCGKKRRIGLKSVSRKIETSHSFLGKETSLYVASLRGMSDGMASRPERGGGVVKSSSNDDSYRNENITS